MHSGASCGRTWTFSCWEASSCSKPIRSPSPTTSRGKRNSYSTDSVTAILGISAFYHDSAAALVVNGDIVAAAQEERFSRRKHDAGFPAAAISYCLQEAGLRPHQLDYIAFYEKPFVKFERLLETFLAFAPRGFMSFARAMPILLKEKLFLRKILRQGVPGSRATLIFLDRQECHAVSAFVP